MVSDDQCNRRATQAASTYGRLCTEFYDIENGCLVESEYAHFDLRAYEPDEFQGVLDSAGFTGIRRWKAFGETAPDPADGEVVFECTPA
jgi:hypothetical protein